MNKKIVLMIGLLLNVCAPTDEELNASTSSATASASVISSTATAWRFPAPVQILNGIKVYRVRDFDGERPPLTTDQLDNLHGVAWIFGSENSFHFMKQVLILLLNDENNYESMRHIINIRSEAESDYWYQWLVGKILSEMMNTDIIISKKSTSNPKADIEFSLERGMYKIWLDAEVSIALENISESLLRKLSST